MPVILNYKMTGYIHVLKYVTIRFLDPENIGIDHKINGIIKSKAVKHLPPLITRDDFRVAPHLILMSIEFSICVPNLMILLKSALSIISHSRYTILLIEKMSAHLQAIC